MTYVCTKCGLQKVLSELVVGRKQCKKCRAAKEMERYYAKRDEINSRRSAAAKADPSVNTARYRNWAKRNPDAYRRITKAACARRVQGLSDGYVRSLFLPQLKADQVPQALVEVKRQQLALLREVRKADDGRK